MRSSNAIDAMYQIRIDLSHWMGLHGAVGFLSPRDVFSGTHNSAKTRPVFKIRPDSDSAHQGASKLGAEFLIWVL